LGAKPPDTFRVGGWERKGLDSSQRISPFAGENPNLRGVSKRGASPSSKYPPPHDRNTYPYLGEGDKGGEVDKAIIFRPESVKSLWR